MSDSDWQPPRCSHGHILLGCPHDDCPEQTTYLAAQREQILNYEARQRPPSGLDEFAPDTQSTWVDANRPPPVR